MPTTLYEDLGGEQALRGLVDRFYDSMHGLPEARGIRALHQEDLTEAREKLFDFLSGWMGGPPLYVEKHGHPRLRARHAPFAIGTGERDEWLLCMKTALQGSGLPEKRQRELMTGFFQVADFMRNQPTRDEG